MKEIVDGVGVHQVVIPLVCFAVCVSFQAWEFAGSHDDVARARSLFKSVRAGWVKNNFLKGTPACNTTRDYIKSAVFFASSAITLATFTAGYAGAILTDCYGDDKCGAEEWLLIVKLGVLAAVLLTIFFVLTQCTRFAVHFSFCINTPEIGGVPMPHSLLVNLFNHTHRYFSLGFRLYFFTIPVFAWIFTPWALLGVTPLYVFMVRGLEDAGFVSEELEEILRLQAEVPTTTASTDHQPTEIKQHAV